MDHQLPISLDSEIGSLNGVLLHRPGIEIEQMTPSTVEQALYSDLLSRDVAAKEYMQIEGVLSQCTNVFYIDSLITDCIEIDSAKKYLLESLRKKGIPDSVISKFSVTGASELSKIMIEGCAEANLNPLYNLYFMRDLGACYNGHSMPMQMSTQARANEVMLTDMIYRYHPLFKSNNAYSNPWENALNTAHMEGGDFLVAGENLFLIGQGCRSNRAGVDAFIKEKSKESGFFHVIIQELPDSPESFIHLDMVFTLLSTEECMVYSPIILEDNKYKTCILTVDNGNVSESVEENMLVALKKIGYDYKPLLCGGKQRMYQDREQWHSGANFFAFAPGKIMGYSRNRNTIEVLSKAGYEVVSASEVLDGTKKINTENDNKKVVVTIESAELVRGGGGCRCMTMPISREKIQK